MCCCSYQVRDVYFLTYDLPLLDGGYWVGSGISYWLDGDDQWL